MFMRIETGLDLFVPMFTVSHARDKDERFIQ